AAAADRPRRRRPWRRERAHRRARLVRARAGPDRRAGRRGAGRARRARRHLDRGAASLAGSRRRAARGLRLACIIALYRRTFMTKFVFVTGGVVSSLGKGIAAASIAALLESRGIR